MLLSKENDQANLPHLTAQQFTTHNNAILATNLSKSVGDAPNTIHILSNLQLQVAFGESVAIVGSSGSGKSTLLGLLAGLDNPTSGQITVKGAAFSSLDEDARAAIRGKNMGFVFQSFQLLPTMTALENVMLPMQLANQPNAQQVATATLEKVGLSARLNHYPKQLSGGEQQRVAIARALLNEPQLLIADEPTGNLDPETGVGIVKTFRQINQFGTAVILATHNMDVIDKFPAHTIVCKGGKLVDSRKG